MIQRGYYESLSLHTEFERREGSWSLARGKSLELVYWNQRRRRFLGWRTRLPGRLIHEWRKRKRGSRRRSAWVGRRVWKWYDSQMDLSRKERRRSTSYFGPRRWRRYTKNGRVDTRGRRRWRRRRVSRWMGSREQMDAHASERKEIGRAGGGKHEDPVLTEFSIRKLFESMNWRRWRRSSRRWTERRRRSWYVYQGREKKEKR